MLNRLLAVALVFATPICVAHAEDAVPAGSTSATATREALDKAIQDQHTRRSGAIAGFAIGAAAIVTGNIVSAVASAQNQTDKDNGRPATRNTTTPLLIGLGVGLPIIGISTLVFVDSQKQINRLQRQRVLLKYSQETHQPVLAVAFDF